MSLPAKDVWIVIAAFNEASRIGKTISSLSPYDWNIVVVDDGSSDQTSATANQAGAIVLRHLINRGQGASLQTGIDFSLAHGAKYIVTFDADGQHQAADIPSMLGALETNRADVVLGSRFIGKAVNMPTHRRLLLKAAVLFTRLTTGLRVTDTHNGLRAMTANTARRIEIEEDRMAHASELLHCIASLRLKFIEHPVTVHYHAETLAKGQRSRDAWGILSRLLISRLFT
jgi:glycosyltransferase involved in cell wall biosynthesis